MNEADKKQLKKLTIFTMFYRYPRRWVAEQEARGDFSKDWIEKEKLLSCMIYRDSSFITTYLECFLRPYRIFPCSRLNVFCKDSEAGCSEHMSIYDGICHMEAEFDMRYLSFTDAQKTVYLMDKIEEVLFRFCSYYSVDDTPVKQQCANIRRLLKEKNMLGPYSIESYKTLRQNGISARLISYHSLHAYHFFVLLSSPVIGKVEIPFFETLPGGPNTLASLGKFYWKDDQTLCIEDSRKGNSFCSSDELLPDKLLDITEYRVTHNAGKRKR